MGRLVSWWVGQPVGGSVTYLVDRLVSWWVGQSVDGSLSQLVGRLLRASVCQLVKQSARSVGLSVSGCVGQSVGGPVS